jgi:Na+/citrate or Na+/malate symporter
MKQILTNKLSKSIFIITLLVITIITYRYINDKDLKSKLYYIFIYILLNLLSINNLIYDDIKKIINSINKFCAKNWFNIIIVTLFILFCENYEENKNAFVKGFKKGYYGLSK